MSNRDHPQEVAMKLQWLVALLLLSTVPSTLSARWITDKVVFVCEDAGNVEFSHYRHLEILGNNCPSCHNEIFQIVASKNPDFTMSAMEKGKSCGACHDGNQAFTVSDNCDACHNL
jgi:c(7)-type cytochrome triheme protein